MGEKGERVGSMSDSLYFLEEKERRTDPMSNSLSFLEGEREDDPMSTSFLEDTSIDHISFPSPFLEEVRSGGRSLSFLVRPTQPYSSTFLDDEVILKGVTAASSYFLVRAPTPRSCLVVVENVATNVTFLH